ncbi:hypothetical protein [Terrabacter sp. Root181]|uniref:hypothetical protein n=1 Tax=Terrabacter sp. Root181 TaxID=1736484 RepID=UPI000A7948B5|nr:hypothetical protein [Terrabacter sp. Root181]
MGEIEHDDLWPYAIASQRTGDLSVFALEVHDSQEFLGVLEMLTARGAEVTHAQLLA